MSTESFKNTPPLPNYEHTDDSEIQKGTKKRIAIIDTSDALEEQARDIAEEKLTEAKENLTGIKGALSRVWKHNLFRPYYRQKEIARAKASISESGNLYVGENADKKVHDEAMNAVVDRFIQEHEEAIHTDAGEKRRITSNENVDDAFINVSVRDLIREFASGNIDEESFHEERNRIIAEATGFSGKKLENTVNHTDNLFEIARQAKISVEHGASIDAIDQEVEVIIGKAKIGVRTESNYNAVDRISAKIQSSKIGQFVNETTISAGVAIAYSVTAGLFERLARSKAVAWGTFGASALIGGAVAGARESVRVEDERRQHSRERAKGKVMTPGMERRAEFEKVIYTTIPAKSLSESLINISEAVTTPEEFFIAINILAEAESRILLSDTKHIDLLSYSDFKSIEQERYALDMARVEAKIKLRRLIESKAITLPYDESFDELYTSTLNVKSTSLQEGDGGIETKDKEFKQVKRKKVAGAVLKGVATGLIIGGAVQETAAFFNDDKDGLFEQAVGMGNDQTPKSVTALEGLRRWIMEEESGVRTMTPNTLPDGSKINLPSGVELIEHQNKPGEFAFTKDGEVISDIQFKDGALTQSSEDLLRKAGVDVTENITHIAQPAQITYTSQELTKQHPDLFTKIHRNFWYDNNTIEFDRNELKLHWGGENNTGIDANGNYAFNIGKMNPDGSTFKNLSIDAQEAMKEGKLKMLLSLSRDTQFNVVEVPIDAQGNVVIDPKSNIAQLFFKNEDGHVRFVGKFAEVGNAITPGADGIAQYEVLATHVGNGIEKVTESGNIVVDTPVTSFGVLDQEPYVEPPMFLPIFGRTPLEKMRNPRKDNSSYAYNGFFNVKREDYEERMSESLRNNPDADLDTKKEVQDYLSRQEQNHLQDIEKLSAQMRPMKDSCKLSICIPVAGHQEEKVIYKTLENYLLQTAKKEDFEIVLFVNQPDKDKKGKPISSDGTLTEIQRFIQNNPEVNISILQKVIPHEKAKIGYIRKLLNDVVLKRSISRSNKDASHIIVSNDADNKGIAPEYIQNFITKFEANPNTDAYTGQLDWDLESYVRNPLIHIGIRFFQYVDIQLRSKSKDHIPSSGANFAFRSSMYAAVNGYSSDSEIAEDVDLGKVIKASRIGSTEKTAVDFAGAQVSRLFTSSRRAEKTLKEGLSPIEMWNKGFSAFDDEVRKIDWGSISSTIDYNKPESLKVLVNNIESVINRSMHAMTWAHKDKEYFKRSLGWLGIKYTFTGANQIKIIDATKLIQRLKSYKDAMPQILRRKTTVS